MGSDLHMVFSRSLLHSIAMWSLWSFFNLALPSLYILCTHNYPVYLPSCLRNT